MVPTEAVRPVPVVIYAVRRGYIDTGLEPSQPPDPVRERAQSGIARRIERATADGPVARPDVEDGVTVHRDVAAFGGWEGDRAWVGGDIATYRGLSIKDLRADLDLREVRER